MYACSDNDIPEYINRDDLEYDENEIARLAAMQEDVLYDEDGNILKDACEFFSDEDVSDLMQ